MDDVRVHRNSTEPAKLGALAFTRGSEIHLGPGQDEHLPHEAWHVVQQKRGQVQATTQMKGVAINADAGLEREADRMGPTAARTTMRFSADHLERRDPTSRTIQGKVKDGQKPVTETDNPSPELLVYIKKAETYLLRNDFHKQYTVIPFHLLETSKKYIFGETHGPAADAKFTAELQRWPPVVGTMVEQKKTFTPADRADVGIPDETVLLEKSLENIHAYAVLSVLEAMTSINSLREGWVLDRWALARNKTFVQEMLKTAASNLLQIDAIRKIYSDFIPAFQRKPLTSARSLRIYRFAVRFNDVWIKEAKSLMNNLRSANDAVQLEGKPRSPPLSELNRRFRKAMNDAGSGIRFLEEMGRAALELNDYPTAVEKTSIAGMVSKAARGGQLDTKPADAARERGMAENASRAAAPLFVKCGEAHVAGLMNLIPDAVPIHQNESLEKVTKKP